MADIVGTTGADTLDGTSDTDTIRGLGGNDQIEDRLGGNDVLDGGEGNDSIALRRDGAASFSDVDLIGGDGNDSLRATWLSGFGLSVDLDGGDGDDFLYVFFNQFSFLSTNVVTISGGTGNDHVFLVHNSDVTLSLGTGTDLVEFTEFLRGMIETVTITDFETGASGDVIDLEAMLANVLTNWNGVDNPFSTGHLRLIQKGTDTLLQIDYDGGGNSWNDLVQFQNTNVTDITDQNLDGQSAQPFDVIFGTDGDDLLIGLDGNEELFGLAGDDVLQGSFGADTLDGGEGNDTVSYEGNDRLKGGLGADSLEGGEGIDTLLYDDASGRIVVRLNNQTITGDRATGDVISGFENVTTGSGNDAVIGSAVANTLIAGAGNDYLDGLGGDDVIDGGTGDDRMNGGSGSDRFVFTSGSDQILDFSQVEDDTVDLTAFAGFRSVADLSGIASQDGADTVFDFGSGNVLRLRNTDFGDLTDGDFQFAPSPELAEPQPGEVQLTSSGSERTPDVDHLFGPTMEWIHLEHWDWGV